MTRTFSSLLLVAALAAGALAQTSQGNAQTAAGANDKTAAAAKPAPAGPTPKSAEELAAIKAVAAAMQNPSGTPAQLDGAVQNLVSKFPQTEFKEWAYTLATQYHYQHNDYAGTLENGEAALKVNPHALLPLLVLASVIPQRVQPTDLDRDQRLAEAEGFDKTALDYADHFPSTVNGHVLTPAQVQGYQQTIRATAHSSLGAIAMDRQQYPQAASQFEDAIQQEAGNNAAQDYYRLAQAQEAEKNYKDALGSVNKALELGAANATLKTLATAEQEKITREMGGTAAPASHP